jgi:peptide/nickel transport system permease protein
MAATAENAVPTAPPRVALGGRFARVVRNALRSRRGRIGAALTLFVIAVAFLGPLFSSTSPTELATTPYAAAGDGGGVLGGDALGRDVLARVLNGGWRLLLLAGAATALAVVLGTAAGVVAAYRGGWVDSVIMRSVDVVLGIPQLVFVLMLLSVIGPKTWLVILGVGLSQAPQVARVLRAAAQDVSERDYVKAVAAWGVPPRTVIGRHVVPSLITPLMVEIGLRLSFSIILVAGLSFLGLGTQPPTPDWGVMINENRLGLASNLWGVLAPSILLGTLAVGTNTLSDAIARANIVSGAAGDPTLQLMVAEAPLTEPTDHDAQLELFEEPAVKA